MALSSCLSQIVVPIYVCHWGCFQSQGIWWIDLWLICPLWINQPVQEVEDMRLRRHPGFQRQFHCSQNSAFIMV